MSAPRAGRAGGSGRGRGSFNRAGSPFTISNNNKSGNPISRGGGLHPADASNSRGAISRGNGRGRGGPHGGAQRASKTWRKTPEPTDHNARDGQRTSLDFTGDRQWRAPENATQKDYKSKIKGLWETLKKNRVTERQKDIRDGKIADPEKKMKLSEAIKPVGTCEDMCSEWERVTRIYDGNVLMPEKIKLSTGDIVPSEVKMVKRFQRSAAGDDEQLPSDLRPPRVLQRTLDYLIDSVINGPGRFERQQEFLWDRTRAIRNDFSIQQVTKLNDVKIAVHCFEHITRYHILALHITAHPEHKPGIEHKQEVEQLTNTLTSLLQYYQDNRRTFEFPNEPEFCAYFIIREIGQVKRPDLESRVQQWPLRIIRHPRVQTALRLYAAACDVTMDVGPLQPFHSVSIAQSNGMRFWSLVNSPAVPYLMACCAETYFRIIRDTTLMNIWRACKRPSKTRLDDLLLSDLTDFLGFDNEDQTQAYCESQGFVVAEREDGNAFLDLSSISASTRYLPGSDRVAIQEYSDRLVEDKRHGRLPAAVIKGLSVAEARRQGLAEDADDAMVETVQASKQAKSAASLNVLNGNVLPISNSSTPSVFNQPSPEPSSNPFSNPFSKIGAVNNNTPSVFSQSATQANANSSNPFASLQAKPQASGSTPPPLSNQQIASQIFSTPSHSPFSSGDPRSGPTFHNTDREAQNANSVFATGNNPFQSLTAKGDDTPAAEEDTETSTGKPTKQPKFSIGQTAPSIFGSVDTSNAVKAPNSGLGNSLFKSAITGLQKTHNADEKSSAAADNNASRAYMDEGDSNSLFIPLASQPAKKSSPETSTNPFASANSNPQPNTLSSATAQEKSLFSAPKETKASTATVGFGQSQQTYQKQAASQSSTPSLFQNPFTSKPPSTQLFQPPSIQQTSLPQQVNKPPVTIFPQAQAPSSSAATDVGSRNFGPTIPNSSHGSDSQAQQVIANSSATSAAIQDRNVQRPVSTKSHVPSVKAPSRDKVLDDICNVYVTEPNGLLEQFIEHQVLVMVGDCWSRVVREKRAEAIADTRRRILSRKYLKRWRDVSWKRKLTRNARRRREELRQSLMGEPPETETSHKGRRVSYSDQAAEVSKMSQTSRLSMGPPLLKSILKKTSGSVTPAPNGDIRVASNEAGEASKRSARGSLNRSAGKQISNALASINVSRIDKNRRYSRLSNSMLGDSGLMNERLMKEASRLVDGRTDTTRTDYFKLKALGLDPNTPIIPRTRKRPSDEEIESAVRKSRLSPAKAPSKSTVYPSSNGITNDVTLESRVTGPASLPWKPNSANKDNDDDLFAQINAVKSALSDTETWYREYREQSERTSADIANETEKQKRLREWRPSVSRTETRWKKEGLPSFLRSSLTPRQTISMERDDSRAENVRPRKFVQQVKSEPEVIDFDAEEEVEEDYSDDDGQEEYGEDDEMGETKGRERGRDASDEDELLYDEDGSYEDEEEEEEDAEEEDDYDDNQHYDTQAFKEFGGSHRPFVNPGSAFATQGASADDAIEL